MLIQAVDPCWNDLNGSLNSTTSECGFNTCSTMGLGLGLGYVLNVNFMQVAAAAAAHRNVSLYTSDSAFKQGKTPTNRTDKRITDIPKILFGKYLLTFNCTLGSFRLSHVSGRVSGLDATQ